jgi:uroporphyrinogen-III synthase
MHNVLIIRAKNQGVKTLDYLSQLDISGQLISLSDVTYPYHNFKDFDLTDFKQIIISSSNALSALSSQQKEILNQKEILSVTQALIDFANVRYFQNMQEVITYIMMKNHKEKVIYLRGNYSSLSSDEEKNLQEYGCNSVLCYHVNYHDREFKEIANNLKLGIYSDILFFSKKSSDYFLKLIQDSALEPYLLNIKLCCISRRVAASFLDVKLANIVIAENANIKSLIKCLDYPLVR